MKARAIGYVRVSTEDQAREGVSLDAQKAKIEAYSQVKDLDLIEVIEDAGISAKDLKRPGVQRVLELAKGRKVDAVIVLKLDRMFRSTEDALKTTRQFDKWGVSFHSISESLDTKSAMGKFFFTLTAALAEMERGIAAERTKVALAYKRSNGAKTGGDVPFGWDVEINPMSGEKMLIEKPKEKNCLRLMWQMRERGMSFRAICKALAEAGHRTKRGQVSWHPQSVSQILRRAA